MCFKNEHSEIHDLQIYLMVFEETMYTTFDHQYILLLNTLHTISIASPDEQMISYI